MQLVHVEVAGQGPDLVLIHGWGLHGGLWNALAARLERDFRVHTVDLPGHGLSSALPHASYTVDNLAAAVAAAVPADAAWVGWSLGGMAALAAGAKARVRKLVLVAANARFVSGPSWPHAVAPTVLDAFAEGLGRDYRGTLMRFLALQTKGSDRARDELRELREQIFIRGEPSPDALEGGLAILKNADLRGHLPQIAAPALLVNGERDTLVPAASAHAMAAQMPNARAEIIAGAGHAPFLSHPEIFTDVLRTFLNE